MDALKKFIENNPYLNEIVSKLENWETDFFIMNEIGGVDAKIYLEYENFGYIQKHSKFMEALEEVLEEHDLVNFDKRTDSIYISTGEEAFVSFIGDELIIGDECIPVEEDFEIWIKLEHKILEDGIYYGLYKAGYYGDCDIYVFDEDYSQHFSQDEKKRKEEIEQILLTYDLKHQLNDTTLMHWDLPQNIFDCLPVELANLDDGVEILSIDEFSPEGVEITFEFFEEDWEGVDTKAIINALEYKQGNEYIYKHKFKTNSLRFLREIGGSDEMSFLSVR